MFCVDVKTAIEELKLGSAVLREGSLLCALGAGQTRVSIICERIKAYMCGFFLSTTCSYPGVLRQSQVQNTDALMTLTTTIAQQIYIKLSTVAIAISFV